MGTIGDSVDRAFRLILVDDRRKLPEEDEAAAAKLWRRTFSRVPENVLLEAVNTWLRENRKGRPNIGEIQEILNRATAAASPVQREDESTLKWAVSILEALSRGGEWAERIRHPNYRHTLDDAERVLRRRGFVTWQDAKRFLEPHWAPSQTSEVTWTA